MAKGMERPNVLFVVFDQMRADCLAGALAAAADLPNLKALMADAVTFTNHVSVTSPCGPARASLLTGQYAMNHRSIRNGTPLPKDKLNLATELRGAGIQPLLYGYTDTSADPRHFAADDPVLTSYEQVMSGFMEALEMRFDDSRTWRAYLAGLGYDVPEGQDIYVPQGNQPDSPAFYKAEHSDTAFLTDRVLADLPTRGQGWCAHVTFIRPHPPFVAPAPYNALFKPADMPPALSGGSPEDYQASHPFNGPAMAFRQVTDMVEGCPDLRASGETTARIRAVYMGLVAELDHHFGRIISHLKETGQYDDTVIIVTSDHGEMLGDHHSWGKMHYYDAAFRVPLVIRTPSSLAGDAQRGQQISLPTESIDVTPTILDLLNIPVPDSMDGVPLSPLLKGEPGADWRKYSVSELDFGDPVSPTVWQRELNLSSEECGLAIIRSDRHTLVQFTADLPPLLFDHNAGGEVENLAHDSAFSDIRLELTEALLRHRMRHAEGQFSRVMITSNGAVRGVY
ncbi:sulfatase-like hydrolase/transferase [Alphaproteobacteria bacterium LSUCC0684]